jgi:type II secretory pathway pseudopilin PulG
MGTAASQRRNGSAHTGGFTYIGLLILVATIGIASAATIQVGSLLERRATEEELLQIGADFRNAFVSYANATPAGQPKEPSALTDLLKDPRYPNTVRHLRKICVDPLTGKAEWGAVKLNGRLIGLYSLSTARPIKAAHFDFMSGHLAGKSSYREWIFTGIPNISRVTGRLVFEP